MAERCIPSGYILILGRWTADWRSQCVVILGRSGVWIVASIGTTRYAALNMSAPRTKAQGDYPPNNQGAIPLHPRPCPLSPTPFRLCPPPPLVPYGKWRPVAVRWKYPLTAIRSFTDKLLFAPPLVLPSPPLIHPFLPTPFPTCREAPPWTS